MWLPSHSNPGTYARYRYGSDYLKHAESWFYDPTVRKTLFSFRSGEPWRSCQHDDKSFHGCYDKYPLDGNVLFHPENFKEWKDKH